MNLEVTIEERNVKFDKDRQGLDELIDYIGKNIDKISRITFSGETSSYTFKRQIHLLINLLNKISDFEIHFQGEKIDKDETVFPVYE